MSKETLFDNPHSDPLLREFWDMCVYRDIEAFLAADWSITADDFNTDNFLGIDANASHNPSQWRPKFPTLSAYQAEFNSQAVEFAETRFRGDPRRNMYAALTLSEPVIEGDSATILKTFDGALPLQDGGKQRLAWQSLFFLRRASDRWRFTGFVGYLPLPDTDS